MEHQFGKVVGKVNEVMGTGAPALEPDDRCLDYDDCEDECEKADSHGDPYIPVHVDIVAVATVDCHTPSGPLSALCFQVG